MSVITPAKFGIISVMCLNDLFRAPCRWWPGELLMISCSESQRQNVSFCQHHAICIEYLCDLIRLVLIKLLFYIVVNR